jgi:hypothetical protein
MLLDLLIHAGSHLIHLDYHTFTLALFACFNVFTSLTIALFAASSSLVFEFHDFAVVNIFERDFEGNFGRFALSNLFFCGSSSASASTSTTKEHVQQILLAGSSASGSLRAVLVIHFTFLGVTKCLIGFVKLLELFNVTSFFVGVKYFSELLILVFDFLLSGIFFEAHDIVVLLVIDLLLLIII